MTIETIIILIFIVIIVFLLGWILILDGTLYQMKMYIEKMEKNYESEDS